MTEPKNALTKQYKKLFKMEGVDIEFQDSGLEYIVEKALEYKLGARGLRSICEAIVTDAMFEIPSSEETKELIINRSYAETQFEKSGLSKLRAA